MPRAKVRSFPQRLGDFLEGVLKEKGFLRRLKEEEVLGVWEEVAGKETALHTRPLRVRKGTLLVACSSSPWVQELTFLREKMVASLNEKIGEKVVKEIRFVVSRRGES